MEEGSAVVVDDGNKETIALLLETFNSYIILLETLRHYQAISDCVPLILSLSKVNTTTRLDSCCVMFVTVVQCLVMVIRGTHKTKVTLVS